MSFWEGTTGGSRPWKRRLNQFVSLHIRQFPCVQTVFYSIAKNTCWRKSRYQTLGQDEEGDGTELYDDRQHVNRVLGQGLVSVAVTLMVAITVLLVERSSSIEMEPDFGSVLDEHADFKRDAPMVLYLGALELLVCGSCAHTAAVMYRRRRHALKHPADSVEAERRDYVKVHLEKECGLEDQQLHGLGFRASSDGLECLHVEAVRPGSLLDKWNRKALGPTPEALVGSALDGDDDDVVPPGAGERNRAGEAQNGETSTANGDGFPSAVRRPLWVSPRAAVVAVNDVTADVGMMQLQLMKPAVTLWVRPEMGLMQDHAGQFREHVFASPFHPDLSDAAGVNGSAAPGALAPPAGASAPGAAMAVGAGRPISHAGPEPTPTNYGASSELAGQEGAFPAADHGGEAEPEGGDRTQPKCACLALEDEEPQILMRWTVCGLLVGWVTLLPVLLMQPHEERPRQQLFRAHLMRPCFVVLPIWIMLWVVDCVQLFFAVKLMHPFWFFGICHVLFPAFLFWHMMGMQAADEKLVLEQRKSREAEAGSALPMVVEDPAPTLLKELVTTNPVALMLLGASASIPICLCSWLRRLETGRGRMARDYVLMVYGPLMPWQCVFIQLLWRVKFIEMPQLYLAVLGMLLSIPCFVTWFCCVMCATRYCRQDMALVERQRLERAKEARAKSQLILAELGALPNGEAEAEQGENELLVDCSEAAQAEWELIYTA